MTQRGQITADSADFSHAVIGLGHAGVSAEMVDDDFEEGVDSGVLAGLKVATVNAVDTEAGIEIPVVGIQEGDVIVAAIKVRVDDEAGSRYSSTVLDDVTYDVTITAEEEVTFAEESFGPADSLLLIYVDESAELA